jgi:hypothetical protein
MGEGSWKGHEVRGVTGRAMVWDGAIVLDPHPGPPWFWKDEDKDQSLLILPFPGEMRQEEIMYSKLSVP